MSQEQILNNDEIDFDDDIDLDSLEMPQLVRRNGIIHQDDEVGGYFILDKPIDKIYHSEICPICLEENEQLIPLKCGHTFCQNDIQKLAENSKTNQSLIKCPICRSYQILDKINEVPDENDFLQLLIQSIC